MPSQEEDVRLLQDCLAGRPGAWEAFVSRFSPYLAGVCRRALRRYGRPAGSQEVDDLLQDVFLGCHQGDLRAYQGRASLLTYLSTLAFHRVLKERGRPLGEALGERLSSDPDPSEIVQLREEIQRLRQEVGKLPPATQLALTLRAEGASLKEVGQTLGISEEAATKLVSRARAGLRP